MLWVYTLGKFLSCCTPSVTLLCFSLNVLLNNAVVVCENGFVKCKCNVCNAHIWVPKSRHETKCNILDLEMRFQIVLREETIAVVMMIVR